MISNQLRRSISQYGYGLPYWTPAPTGIASGEAFGTPDFVYGQDLTATGIASGEAFGSTIVHLAVDVTLTPTGIASAEAVGTPPFVGERLWAIVGSYASGSPGAGAQDITLDATYTDGMLYVAVSGRELTTGQGFTCKANTSIGDAFTLQNSTDNSTNTSEVATFSIDASTVTGGVDSVYVDGFQGNSAVVAIIRIDSGGTIAVLEASGESDTSTTAPSITTGSLTGDNVFIIGVAGTGANSTSNASTSATGWTNIVRTDGDNACLIDYLDKGAMTAETETYDPTFSISANYCIGIIAIDME